MKILYLSQYFPPEMGAPSARVFELSRSWAEKGHEVTVLTGFPNHPTGIVPIEYRGRHLLKEKMSGINVVRVPIYAAANRGFAKRVLNYFSFSASAALVGPLVTSRPDIIIATSPQFLCGLSGQLLSWIKRVPFVFEVRDLWPRSIVEVGAMRANSPAVRALEFLEIALYKSADHIVAVTDSFVDEIAAKGVAREKVSVVTNGVDLELFQPCDRIAARISLGMDQDRFIATYVGTHGMAHGLDLVLDAAMLLRNKPVDFLLVGEGAEKAALKERARRESLTNVRFLDQQPRSEVARLVAASNLCLVLLRDKALFKTVIPSKIFEFMGAGRPMLTTVDGESRGIVERAGAGIFSPPGDAAALAQAIDASSQRPDLDHMGLSGRRYVEEHFSRPALAKEYLSLLEKIIRG